MLPTIMSRGPIDPWTRTPRSIAPFSASAPSHHSLPSAYFITNIAESNFRYTQVVLRIKFPPNFQMPPHTHPYSEVVTVISGNIGTCPFRKSYPDVLMMQSGQDWDSDNDTGPLDCSMQGRILL